MKKECAHGPITDVRGISGYVSMSTMLSATSKLLLLLLLVLLDCGLCAQTRQPPQVKLRDSDLTLTLDSSKLTYSPKEHFAFNYRVAQPQ
jgi:hypothetical protein